MRASLDWLSGRLKGDLKRRALLLRSRSIPPSRSMSTAVHGCWGARVRGYLAGFTQFLPCGHTQYMNCQRQVQLQVRLEKEQCHRESTQSASQTVRPSVSQSLIDSTIFRVSMPPRLCFYFMFIVASRLAISSRAGLKNQTTKKESRFKGHWPG